MHNTKNTVIKYTFAFKTHKCGTINRQSKPIHSTGELDKAAGDSTYTIKWKKVLEEMIVP